MTSKPFDAEPVSPVPEPAADRQEVCHGKSLRAILSTADARKSPGASMSETAIPVTSQAVVAAGQVPAPERRPDQRGADRRTRPTPMFSRFSLFGGRRSGDRRGVAGSASYVDVYEPWLAGCLVAIGMLCALDAIFTLLYLQRGGSEANPLMESLIGCGPQTFVLVKCGITNIGLLVLCLHKNFRHVKIVIGSLLALYAALFAYHLYLAALLS